MRKLSSHRGVGKENQQVGSQVSNKGVHESGHNPLQESINGPIRQANDPTYVGVHNSPCGGDVCGATGGRTVPDCGPSDGQSSAIGDQLLHPSGEQCALLDDDTGSAIHNIRANEGITGDVPRINA